MDVDRCKGALRRPLALWMYTGYLLTIVALGFEGASAWHAGLHFTVAVIGLVVAIAAYLLHEEAAYLLDD